MKQFLKISLYAVLAVFSTATYMNAAVGDPDISDTLRLEAAQKVLKDQPQLKSIYVKGLVCSSCGIGLRIHLKKVPGIDKQQFKGGVDLDVDTQLVTVAVKEGETLDMARVFKAIHKAGYDPVHYFEANNQDVQRVEFK